MNNIALFGTSADPPTAGHQKILEWLSQNFDLVAVWAADNPFKQHQTPLAHREMMLKLLIAEIQCQNIGIYPELSSRRTLETVERAKEYWQQGEFTLVIGSDLTGGGAGNHNSGLPLLKWYRIEDLLRQVKLLVIPRPGYPIAEENLEELRRLGGQIAIASLTGSDVSSTAYRQNGDTEVLTSPVEAYIHRERLYA
jgi:nicotinate-nucleotide adenylyltransferase